MLWLPAVLSQYRGSFHVSIGFGLGLLRRHEVLAWYAPPRRVDAWLAYRILSAGLVPVNDLGTQAYSPGFKPGVSQTEIIFCVPTSGHQKQHEHVFLKLDQELRDIKSSMNLHYLELDSENDALTTGVKYGPCWIGPGWGKKKDFRRFSDDCGNGAWIRKRFLPRSSVGCPGLVTGLSWPRQPSSGSTRRRR